MKVSEDAPEQSRPQPVKPIVPLILAVALFMEQMDTSVIATSLPQIAADVGTEPVALKLALTSYLVALAIFIPISGWMADRLGARNVFRWAIVVFMLGSVACAFADSLSSFVLSRFFQGIGGAMMTPVSRLVLVRLAPREQLVSAMTWLTIPALMGPVVGPPLGGFLTTYFSWHWIFLINVPIGMAGIILATKFLPRTGFREQRALDYLGFLIAGVAFSGIVFGISVVSLPALPPVYGIAGMVVGLLACVLYWWRANRIESPLLDPKMFGFRTFAASIIGSSIFRIGVNPVAFVMPLMLQISFGMSPFEAGMVTFTAAGGAIAIRLCIKPILARFGFRTIMLGSVVLTSINVGVCALFNTATPIWLIMTVFFFNGLLRSGLFTSNAAIIYSEVDDENVAQATSIFAVVQQISTAVGVAVAGLALEASSRWRGEELGLFDFQFAFVVMGAITLSSIFWFWRLDPRAGANVSGHHA